MSAAADVAEPLAGAPVALPPGDGLSDPPQPAMAKATPTAKRGMHGRNTGESMTSVAVPVSGCRRRVVPDGFCSGMPRADIPDRRRGAEEHATYEQGGQ